MNHRSLALTYLAGAVGLAMFYPAAGHAAECGQLASLKLPHTEITRAENVAAGAFAPPAGTGNGAPGGPPAGYSHLPAFCRVAGTLRPTPDSDIRFEVWLPASNWNGKFVGVGNGVWAGAITYFSMVEPLSLGYATAATDDGHQGNPLDASFAALADKPLPCPVVVISAGNTPPAGMSEHRAIAALSPQGGRCEERAAPHPWHPQEVAPCAEVRRPERLPLRGDEPLEPPARDEAGRARLDAGGQRRHQRWYPLDGRAYREAVSRLREGAVSARLGRVKRA